MASRVVQEKPTHSENRMANDERRITLARPKMRGWEVPSAMGATGGIVIPLFSQMPPQNPCPNWASLEEVAGEFTILRLTESGQASGSLLKEQPHYVNSNLRCAQRICSGQWKTVGGLAVEWKQAENGRVREKQRVALWTVAILCASFGCWAQYQDRDRSGVPKTSASAPPAEERIDINHASLDELLKVPGLGRGWAARILRYRPYRTKQDLADRGVVSGEVYDRIKDFVIAHREKQ